MDRLEYEALQDMLRNKLRKKNYFFAGSKYQEAYEEGIKAAMSILSRNQKSSLAKQWIRVEYDSPTSSDGKKIAYQCPRCRTHWDNATPCCPFCGQVLGLVLES